MTQSEHILEYIDGTLDAEAEQRLFDAMAGHPELRVELRQYINIGDAVRSDREAFAPPAYIERSLMAGLGLGPIVADVGGSVGGGFARLWLGKLGSLLTGFIIGVVLAGTGMYFVMGSGASSVVASGAVSGAGADRVVSTGVGSAGRLNGAALPSDGSFGDRASTAVVDTVVRSRGTDVAETSRGNEGRGTSRGLSSESIRSAFPSSVRSSWNSAASVVEQKSTSTTMTEERLSSLDSLSSKSVLPSVPRQMPVTTATARPSSEPIERVASPEGLDALRSQAAAGADVDADGSVLLEGRYLLGGATFQTRARSVPAAFPENWAVGGYARLDDAFYLGFEGGMERYAQTLYVNSHDTLAVDQQPRYLWGGLAARYLLGTIPALDIQPYVQATVGGTSAGPLVRMRIGAARELFGGLSFTGGFEASSLVYTYNNQKLFSARWGLTGSIQYDLSRLW
jgi:hypothetical protein